MQVVELALARHAHEAFTWVVERGEDLTVGPLDPAFGGCIDPAVIEGGAAEALDRGTRVEDVDEDRGGEVAWMAFEVEKEAGKRERHFDVADSRPTGKATVGGQNSGDEGGSTVGKVSDYRAETSREQTQVWMPWKWRLRVIPG